MPLKNVSLSPVCISLFIIALTLLPGCTSKQDIEKKAQLFNPQQTIKQRNIQLKQLKQWQIIGKIAFMKKTQRDRVYINWQVDELHKKQSLNLTTYLGINVLQLSSVYGKHRVKADGKEYKTHNLSELIQQLTGFNFPVAALNLWLKGLAYKEDDLITVNPATMLPSTLTSILPIKGELHSRWHISYDNYRLINDYMLATKFTIKKDDLLIKIVIKDWVI